MKGLGNTFRALGIAWTLAIATSAAALAQAPAEPQAGELNVIVDTSRTTNLFHWVNNLAGSSRGKTQQVYVRHWIQRFGQLSDIDRRRLRAWRKIRSKRTPEDRLPDPTSCFPNRTPHLSRYELLTVAGLRARSIEDFERRAREVVTDDEAAQLAAAMRHFDARFERVWRESDFIHEFATDLGEYFQRADVRKLLDEFIRFLGAEVDSSDPFYYGLVGLLQQGPTHAEANHNHFLIEVRPLDTALDLTEVIFHEIVHDLVRRMPLAKREQMLAQFIHAGHEGQLAWQVWHEALPTALGQGVATATIHPRAFRLSSMWYHLPGVDRLAHVAYEPIRSALKANRTVTEDVVGPILERMKRTRLGRLAPLRYVGDAPLVVQSELQLPLASARDRISLRNFALEQETAGRFLRRYGCSAVVLLVTDEKLRQLIAEPNASDWVPSAIPDEVALTDGHAGALFTFARTSGAPGLVIVVNEPEDTATMLRSLAREPRWPRGPRLFRRGSNR